MQAERLIGHLRGVFLLPEGVSDEMRAFWQGRFDLMMTDPRLPQMLTVAGYTGYYGYADRDLVTDVVRRISSTTPEIRAMLAERTGIGRLDQWLP